MSFTRVMQMLLFCMIINSPFILFSPPAQTNETGGERKIKGLILQFSELCRAVMCLLQPQSDTYILNRHQH